MSSGPSFLQGEAKKKKKKKSTNQVILLQKAFSASYWFSKIPEGQVQK